MAGTLTYRRGDATQPAGAGPRFIVHCCNDLGKWGAGFVLAISRRWLGVEEAYYSMHEDRVGYELGRIQIVEVEDNLYVVNLIGQHGTANRQSIIPPVRYGAIRTGLARVAKAAYDPNYRGEHESVQVHCPKFGAGLAGGDWSVIEQIIKEELVDKGISVTVYEFDG